MSKTEMTVKADYAYLRRQPKEDLIELISVYQYTLVKTETEVERLQKVADQAIALSEGLDAHDSNRDWVRFWDDGEWHEDEAPELAAELRRRQERTLKIGDFEIKVELDPSMKPGEFRVMQTGLDDGPYLPRKGPRKKPAPKSPEALAEIRAKAWATRRANAQRPEVPE